MPALSQTVTPLPSDPSRGRRRSRQAGFLLTETLATFTISAFVLLGLVSAASVLLRAVDRSVAHVQDVDDLGRTMNAIARDVSGLARARWDGFEPQSFVFRGGPNSLYFAHAERDADGSRATRVIAFREIVVGAGTRLMRGDAPLPLDATDFDGLRFGQQRELATGPARLRFYYVKPLDAKPRQASRDGGSSDAPSEPERLRSWPMGPKLPAAIIVEAVDRDSSRLIVSMRLPIRANADIGCLSGDATPAPGMPPMPAPAQPQGGPDVPLPIATPAALPATAPGTSAAANSAFCERSETAATPAPPPPPVRAGAL